MSSSDTIIFVTGNQGKIARLELALSLFASPTVVEGVDLEVAEIQAETVLEVAQVKARAAYAILGKPLVVHDCGLCVAALNDFPGPMTKYANYRIGTEGLLALLRDEEDRRAGWADAVVYVDGDGGMRSFTPSELYTGEIAAHPPRKYNRFRGEERALGRLFIPTAFGLRECVADLSEEEYQTYRREAPSVWNDFARWWGAGGGTEGGALEAGQKVSG